MAFSLTEYAKGNVLAVQEYSILSWRGLANLFSQPRYFGDIVQQMDTIGVGSLPIVVLTGFFTGAVLALQSANSLARFGELSLTGQLVSMSMVRELGPVLTGLMVAGRNASGMASDNAKVFATEKAALRMSEAKMPTNAIPTETFNSDHYKVSHFFNGEGIELIATALGGGLGVPEVDELFAQPRDPRGEMVRERPPDGREHDEHVEGDQAQRDAVIRAHGREPRGRPDDDCGRHREGEQLGANRPTGHASSNRWACALYGPGYRPFSGPLEL